MKLLRYRPAVDVLVSLLPRRDRSAAVWSPRGGAASRERGCRGPVDRRGVAINRIGDRRADDGRGPAIPRPPNEHRPMNTGDRQDRGRSNQAPGHTCTALPQIDETVQRGSSESLPRTVQYDALSLGQVKMPIDH